MIPWKSEEVRVVFLRNALFTQMTTHIQGMNIISILFTVEYNTLVVVAIDQSVYMRGWNQSETLCRLPPSSTTSTMYSLPAWEVDSKVPTHDHTVQGTLRSEGFSSWNSPTKGF